jgi:hypothetical protein
MFLQLKVCDAKSRVPCIDGFVVTITSVQMLFKRFTSEHGFSYLLRDRLNQDCLETYFSIIRGRGGFHDNSNPYGFSNSFRQVLMNHLLLSIAWC